MNKNIFSLGEIRFVNGVGNLREGTGCAMATAAAIHASESGQPLDYPTDELECCCPVASALIIRRNDSFDDNEERGKWARRLIPRIIGSRDDSKTQARAFRCADVAVRKIAVGALRKAGLRKEAEKLKALPQIVDQQTSSHAADAAYAAYEAYAAHCSHCDHYYSHCAYAAHCAAYAAYDADEAAYAAAAAADDAATWQLIDDLIEEFLPAPKREHERQTINLETAFASEPSR